MKRGRISNQFLLYFLMLLFLAATVGCSSSDDAPPAAATTYTISGVVSGNIAVGVTINLTGDKTATTTTVAGGIYSFTGVANGTYVVTPVVENNTFDPVSTEVTVNGSDMTADFVATAMTGATYSISGTVSGAAAAGVKITLSGWQTGSTTTAADGSYTFAGLWNNKHFIVTPYLSGYSFSPANIDIASLTADSTGNNFTATAKNFTQADLVGTWNFQQLTTGNESGWSRGTVTIDVDGNVTFDSCLSNNGTCTPASVVLTIDQTTGEIADSDNVDNHYTMASNKKFIAGTQHSVGTPHPAIIIFQKKVDGVSYANADLYNKSFVYHRLSVGNSDTWEYGSGTTNGSGVVTPGNYTDPTGTYASGGGPGTISVSAAGIVTFTNDTAFSGFLSADKKTIVGTETSDTGTYSLIIIQITTNQSSSLSQVVGTSYVHLLGTGAENFWAHETVSITSGGVNNFDNWETSGSVIVHGSGTGTMAIGSSGRATVTLTSGTTDFHGQLSYDGTFMVATETYEPGVYTLDIFTK